MNSVLQTLRTNAKLLGITFVGVVFAYFFINTVVENRLQDIELFMRVQIENQETLLATIAEATARNGADSVTERIVKDCTIAERTQFDELLGRLNDGLSRSQLVELERLFGRCGSFYAERKSVMVARLAREIEVYTTYVENLNTVRNDDFSRDFQLDNWNALATAEKKQSELFTELVDLQDNIITTLLLGSSSNSPEIIAILQSVKEVQDNLLVTRKQAATIRGQLVSL